MIFLLQKSNIVSPILEIVTFNPWTATWKLCPNIAPSFHARSRDPGLSLSIGVSIFMSQQSEEVKCIIVAAIESLEPYHLRLELLKGLINPLVRERRTFVGHSGTAEGDVWTFFIIPGRPSIALAYTHDGYGLLGRRWGLVWAEHPHYGDPDAWYPSLLDLIVESGYFSDTPCANT